MTETTDKIDRGNERIVGGFKLGASRGKREDQDEAIDEFARRLAGEFPHDISIRFNTNRLGGGAWLVDGKRNSQVGLGAELKAPEWHREKFQEYLDSGLDSGEKPTSLKYMDPDELVLKYSIHIVPPAVDRDECNRDGGLNSDGYVRKLFGGLDEAWDWFTEHVNRDGVNPPTDD